MNDRELIELAAMAGGLTFVGPYLDIDGNFIGLRIREDNYPNGFLWNPLTDDGDALRLAVKLDIEIYQGDDEGPAVCAGYWGKPERRDVARLYCIEPLVGDHYAATRRAIVHAAAKIGKMRILESSESS